MNFWPRWVNAITNATAHLSLVEMGAYDRLLDHYYKTEAPLPAAVEACCRIVRAMSKDERAAVASVLDQFFVLDEAGYRQARADEEIAQALPKIAAAQANGKLGGRPRKTQQEPSKKPTGFPAGTHGEPRPKAHQTYTNPTEDLESVYAHTEGEIFPSEAATQGHAPTVYGSICRAIRQAGISNASPSKQTFRALVDAGATAAEFVAHVPKALLKSGDRFAYVCGCVQGDREQAATLAGRLHQGGMPTQALTAKQAESAKWIKGTSLDRSTHMEYFDAIAIPSR